MAEDFDFEKINKSSEKLAKTHESSIKHLIKSAQTEKLKAELVKNHIKMLKEDADNLRSALELLLKPWRPFIMLFDCLMWLIDHGCIARCLRRGGEQEDEEETSEGNPTPSEAKAVGCHARFRFCVKLA